MQNAKIIQRIEELKPTTESSIMDRQRYLVPSFIELNPKLIWDAYKIAGDRFTITGDFAFAIQVSNLPYNQDVIDKREEPYFIDSLKNMVERNEIRPILIFYNNLFIPWSKIKIVRDIYVSYVLLGDVKDYEHVDSIKCVSFPFNINYKESQEIISEPSSLIFDKNGEWNSTQGNIVISPADPCIFFLSAVTSNAFNKYEVEGLSRTFSIFPFNFCFVFKDHQLYPDAKIEVDKYNLLTVDDGSRGDWSELSIIFYLCLSGNKNSNSHEFKIANAAELIESAKTNNNTPTDDSLINRLDFHFSIDKLYETNIADSIRSVMDYDSELMDKIYTDLSMIDTVEYTGAEFIKLAKNGYVTLNENRKKILDDGQEVLFKIRPMLFVNNTLYEHMRGIIISANMIKIPTSGIDKNDRIEILLFKEIINKVYIAANATIDSDDKINLISTEEVLAELEESNLEIYTSTTPDNAEISMTSVDEFNRVQFKMDSSSIHENDGKISFEVNTGEHMYSGTIPITLVSKKQFRYMGFVSQSIRFNFTLTPDFNFCLNKNQYMIFINGKKIEQNNFRLISADPKRPFDDISIYMSIEYGVGDRIDVFYLPMVLKEFISAPRIPLSGNLYLDRTKFDYGLNKNMYLIFINGNKIASSQIKNINSSKLHIDADINTVNDLCILQHIKSQDVLREAFVENESEWDNATNSLNWEKLSKTLNLSNDHISDVEEDFNAWQIDNIEILHEIARDYWLSTRVYEGGDFIYDYDDIIIDGKDIYESSITRLQNAMIEYYRIFKEHPENISDEELATLAAYNFQDEEYEARIMTTIKSYINRINHNMTQRLDKLEQSINEEVDEL